MPIELNRGLNRLRLTPVATATGLRSPAVAEPEQLLIVQSLMIAGRY